MERLPAKSVAWVRSGVLSGAADLVSELDGDPRALVLQCGLEARALYTEDLPCRGSAVVGFYEAAADSTACIDFGIRLAARQSFAILGPLWLMMHRARNIEGAIEVLEEFFILHTSGAFVGLEREADGSAFVTYSLAADVNGQDRQTMELGLALLCAELRTHCGPHWSPKAVLFCHDRPPTMDSHRRCFGASISFNQERNALWLDAACLRTPLADDTGLTRGVLAALPVSHVEDAVAVAVKVEAVIRSLLPFLACDRKTVAKIVNLSERSMQRRLAEAGTNFQQLRDRVRADIALKYLLQSSLRAAEIGEILGFSEPAAFSRAFRRQHGFTPQQARGRASRESITAI
jgi:AraC-like DNA-binding protein